MRLATDELNLTPVVSRRFAASPERVFDAWFDPNAVGAWLFATPGGISKHVEIDACVGGGLLTLTHRLDPEWAALDASIRAGWASILEGLARATGEPGNGHTLILHRTFDAP